MPLIDYSRTNRPVFDIDLDADPYDRWQEVGRRNKAKPGKPLIQTNHFDLPAHRHHNGDEYQGEDCEICDRYAALHDRLKKKPQDFADAFSRIRGRPVTHAETMNQMALRPADGKAVVRVRE